MADSNTNQTGMVHTDIQLLGLAESSQAGHSNAVELETPTKDRYILTKAESIKPTHADTLKNVKESLQTQQNQISQKLSELAMTAIKNDDYDVAEVLLKTASVQYNNESAEKILATFDLNSDRAKTIECKDKKKRSDTYMKIAQDLIDEGHIKVAESILIIAGYTSATYAGSWRFEYSSNIRNLLKEVQKLLYPNVVPFIETEVWKLSKDENYFYNTSDTSNSSDEESECMPQFSGVQGPVYYKNFCPLRELDPTSDVITYKCYYYIHMAFVAFKCADDIQLALKFLEEAETIDREHNEDAIQKYKRIVEKSIK